ncbi:hypothetical protein ABT160_41830 [Streptomyces sp. NPDC001941]|uniref:hypothetical protein n=1 Tax=Streptomyces sp. NPDC001941 TaxID=3154659 RepID=UPI003332835E
MRAIRPAAALLMTAAAVTLSASAASAADAPKDQRKAAGGTYLVTPSTVAAGGRVQLTAPGCSATATASSGIFDTVTIPPGGAATATVDWDAKKGAMYTVSFTCPGGTSGTAEVTVAGGSAAPTTSSTSVPATPRGVRGGLGGSVGVMDAGELAAGTALVVAAATGVVYVMRRRTEGRQH